MAVVGKVCRGCREMKPLSEYYRQFMHGKWVHRSRCKACLIAEAQHRTANP